MSNLINTKIQMNKPKVKDPDQDDHLHNSDHKR
jgi:hypothetical protein